MPKVRFGRHWVNVLWALPLIFVLLVIGVVVSQALRQAPAVQEFLLRYPGIPASAQPVTTGYPGWLVLRFRDIRAKTASDTGDLGHSQRLLGHKNRDMTEHYVRERIGQRVKPLR